MPLNPGISGDVADISQIGFCFGCYGLLAVHTIVLRVVNHQETFVGASIE
jgi:hypothetical protein